MESAGWDHVRPRCVRVTSRCQANEVLHGCPQEVSDVVHSIMPSHIVRNVKAKVRAISRFNMAQPAKRYRGYKWSESDRHTVW